MSAHDLLDRARQYGVHIETDGERLKLRADRQPPADLLEEIRRHKPAILRELADTLTAEQEAAICRWLDHIGEHHEPSRAECLDRCRRDPQARTYFLRRSKEALN